VRDGVYDPSAVDKQLGCACLIKSMIAIDPTITFTGATITPVEPDPAKPVSGQACAARSHRQFHQGHLRGQEMKKLLFVLCLALGGCASMPSPTR
jgi:hypothetical protein